MNQPHPTLDPTTRLRIKLTAPPALHLQRPNNDVHIVVDIVALVPFGFEIMDEGDCDAEFEAGEEGHYSTLHLLSLSIKTTQPRKMNTILLATFLTLTTASPAIAGLSGHQTANIDYCKEKNYQDCVFGVSRAANDCIALPDNYPLLSVKFENTVKCQVFTDKQCGFSADVSMR
ncbi:hypothetical protein EG328_011620 [Venturia inaequalis]|uniref:Uncharacterized protein n=1 Tax=Venturia inaequalis TaxID=5025 RepID=A0A8H3UC65_VENIN|nr:hypothetical protein EG327_011690 [Venturia inaequalis]KAE9981469.1 hypothetical protein EG328_011620 [Venturia inaequalis]